MFGLTAEQVLDSRGWYNPRWHYENEPETRAALDLIFNNHFSPRRARHLRADPRHAADQGRLLHAPGRPGGLRARRRRRWRRSTATRRRGPRRPSTTSPAPGSSPATGRSGSTRAKSGVRSRARWNESSRHTPCAVLRRRHTECAYYIGEAVTWEQRYRLWHAARTSLVPWAALSLVAAMLCAAGRPVARPGDRLGGVQVQPRRRPGRARDARRVDAHVHRLRPLGDAHRGATGQRATDPPRDRPGAGQARGEDRPRDAHVHLHLHPRRPRAGRGPGSRPARERRRLPEPGVHRRLLPVRPATLDRTAPGFGDAPRGRARPAGDRTGVPDGGTTRSGRRRRRPGHSRPPPRRWSSSAGGPGWSWHSASAISSVWRERRMRSSNWSRRWGIPLRRGDPLFRVFGGTRPRFHGSARGVRRGRDRADPGAGSAVRLPHPGGHRQQGALPGDQRPDHRGTGHRSDRPLAALPRATAARRGRGT